MFCPSLGRRMSGFPAEALGQGFERTEELFRLTEVEGFWRSGGEHSTCKCRKVWVSVVIRGTTVFKSDWHTGYQERKSKMIRQGLGLKGLESKCWVGGESRDSFTQEGHQSGVWKVN